MLLKDMKTVMAAFPQRPATVRVPKGKGSADWLPNEENR